MSTPLAEGNVYFVINIKADGLVDGLKSLLEKYAVHNYFVFDMSLPQMLGYRVTGLIFFRDRANLKKFLFIEGKS